MCNHYPIDNDNMTGEIIEEFLGKRLGLSAMGAAAWGNLVSDMAGRKHDPDLFRCAGCKCMCEETVDNTHFNKTIHLCTSLTWVHAGVFLGGTVNQIAHRIGATEPVLDFDLNAARS
eukprot:758587-Hanusia_phi.AAC.3